MSPRFCSRRRSRRRSSFTGRSAWAATWLVERGHLIGRAAFSTSSSRGWWLLVLLVVAHWLAPRHVGTRVDRRVRSATQCRPRSGGGCRRCRCCDRRAQTQRRRCNAAIDAGDSGRQTTTIRRPAPRTTPEFDAEQVIYNQPSLLDAAVAKLKPQTPGVVDLYVVAFAGDAEEDVFRNEAEYAEKLFGNASTPKAACSCSKTTRRRSRRGRWRR